MKNKHIDILKTALNKLEEENKLLKEFENINIKLKDIIDTQRIKLNDS